MAKKIDSASAETYFTDWKLTGLYDRTHCLYDSAAREANTVFSRTRLLGMADSILDQGMSACAVRFFGGEPGLHPYLPDLVRHFAAKHAWLTLATSGRGKSELYQDLARSARPGRLSLEITWLPQITDITPFLLLAGAFIEKGQHVHFRVILPPGVHPGNRIGTLLRLRQALPFTLETLPLSHVSQTAISGSIPREFSEACAAGPALAPELARQPSFWPAVNESLVFIPGKNGNTMRIFPNGAYAHDFSDTAPMGLPLWRECRSAHKFAAVSQGKPGRDIATLSDLVSQYIEQSRQLFPEVSDLKEGIERVLKATPLEASKKAFLQALLAVRDTPDDLAPFLMASEAQGDLGAGENFVFERPLKKGEIGALAQALKTRTPWLRFPVQVGKADLLNIPLAILANAQEYEFQFKYGENSLLWISGKSRIAPVYGSVPDISVIIPAFNSAATIERCINSVLIQPLDNIEIIVVDDGSTDDTPEKLRELARIYPEKIRLSLQAQNRGPGYARNMGISLATGRFLTFVDSDDMLAEGFLASSLELIERENADIAAFALVFVDSDRPAWFHEIEPGSVSGAESLRWLLLKKAGAYAAYARLYRADLVRRHAIRFSEQAIHQDIFFSIQAFYHSGRTVVTDSAGYYRYLDPNSHSRLNHGKKHLESFFGAVNFLEDFFRTRGLDPEDEALRFAIRRIYDWDRRQIFGYLGNTSENPEEIFTPDLLEACAKSRHALLCILEDYAYLNSHGRPAYRKLDVARSQPATEGPFLLSPFGNADSPAASSPLISVIVAAHNQGDALAELLASVFNQDFEDYEVLLVDNCSDDGSYELAQSLAGKHPALRLYRLQKHGQQDVCRNLALEKARGKYVVFAESALEPGFLGIAAWLTEKRKADIGLFSWQIHNGESQIAASLEDGIISPAAALELYFQNGIAPGIGAKIFRTDLIRASGAEQGAYLEEHNFLAGALRKACVIFTSSFPACAFDPLHASACESDSGNALQKNSGCRIFRDLAEQAIKSGIHPLAPGRQAIWNLENGNLDIWKAYMDAKGEMRLAEAEAGNLLANGSFTAAALLGMSRKQASYPNAQGLQYIERECLACNWQFAEPMLSVIITLANNEQTLQKCLEAVLSQSLHSLEIIVVDDASTDNSLRICEQYAAQDRRLRVIHNDSAAGPGHARNLAFREARGAFVAFLEGDMHIQPEFLLKGVTRLIVTKEAQFIQFGQPGMASRRRLERAWDGAFHLDASQLLELYSEGGCGLDRAAGKIYRSDFLRAAGAVFQEHVYGEELFLLRVYSHASLGLLYDEQMCAKIDEVSESGQLNARFGQKELSGFMQANAEIADFFQEWGNQDLADKCLARRYQRVRPQLLEYLGRLRRLPIASATEDVLGALQAAPGFFRALFSDYARLWSLQRPMPAMPEPPLAKSQQFIPEMLTIHDALPASDTPLVSIIIPAWNTEATLARAVETALAQGDDAEIIVIEDNSDRDATFSLARSLAESSNRIRLFRTRRNSGLGAVRNLGMSVARGKYVTFLDSDDWLGANFIAALRPMLDGGEPEIISCSITRVLQNTQSTRHKKPDIRQPGWQTLIELMEGKYSHWEAWGRVFRLDFLRENDIRFSNYIYEDVPFQYKAFLLAKYNLLSSVNSVWSERGGEESLMNVARRGRLFFESQIYNLKIAHDLADEFCDSDLRDLLLEKYAAWIYQEENIFRKDVLTFMDACRRAGFASPLDNETVNTMLLSKPFLGRVLADMGALWEAG